MTVQKKRNVTIKHVAAEAGVSLQTVSRVINNGPNVTEGVRDRVNAAIARLGYVPNLAARRLGGSRSYLILSLNDRNPTLEGWEARRGNDWVDQMLLGGMTKCAEHGYHLLFELVDAHADDMERQIQSALSSLHPDGVILTPPHSENPAIHDLLARNGVTFACIGWKGECEGFTVYMDDRKAAYAAARHLLELGHRRIAFVKGHPEYSGSEERLGGFCDAMAERGVAIDDTLVQPGDFTYEAGTGAMNALADLRDPPTAVIASSDQMALGVLHVAAKRGFHVPRDLSLVSFDDTPTVNLAVPPLTAIRQPIAAMTATAAELLIESKSGIPRLPARNELPFELIVRESTAPCRA